MLTKWVLILTTFVPRMLCSVGSNVMPAVVLVILSKFCRTLVFVHLMRVYSVRSSSVAVVCLFLCRKYCKHPRLMKRHRRQIWPDMVFLLESITVSSIILKSMDILSVSCLLLRVPAINRVFRVILRSLITWISISRNLPICQNRKLRIKNCLYLKMRLTIMVRLVILRVMLNISIILRKLMAISVVIFHFGI